MSTITVNLSISSIDAAIRAVERRKRQIEQGMDKAANMIAEAIRAAAERRYAEFDESVNATYRKLHEADEKYPDKSPYGQASVTVERGEKTGTYIVSALGEQVVFLEFGAGVSTDVSHPYADNVSFTVAPGSWSQDHSQMYAKYGYWYYNGIIFYGVDPLRCLYNAVEEVKPMVKEIVRRAFQ